MRIIGIGSIGILKNYLGMFNLMYLVVLDVGPFESRQRHVDLQISNPSIIRIINVQT